MVVSHTLVPPLALPMAMIAGHWRGPDGLPMAIGADRMALAAPAADVDDFLRDIELFEQHRDFTALASGLAEHAPDADAVSTACRSLAKICRAENRGQVWQSYACHHHAVCARAMSPTAAMLLRCASHEGGRGLSLILDRLPKHQPCTSPQSWMCTRTMARSRRPRARPLQ